MNMANENNLHRHHHHPAFMLKYDEILGSMLKSTIHNYPTCQFRPTAALSERQGTTLAKNTCQGALLQHGIPRLSPARSNGRRSGWRENHCRTRYAHYNAKGYHSSSTYIHTHPFPSCIMTSHPTTSCYMHLYPPGWCGGHMSRSKIISLNVFLKTSQHRMGKPL